jgi:hypothetical protein
VIRLVRFLVFAVLIFLVVSQAAQAAWTVADTDPSGIASDFNHRDILVTVTVGTGYAGQAFVGGAEDKVWLTRLAYQGARRGDGQSVWVLLHEIGHTIGITDEHAASVWGYQHLVPVLRGYYGQSLKQAKAGYRQAVVAGRSLGREYQP